MCFKSKTNFKETKAVLNQVVANLYTAHTLHQVHWYMRGASFMVWHLKMSEYMSFGLTLDEVSERLITLGGKPYSTLTDLSNIVRSRRKKLVNFSKNVEESLARCNWRNLHI